MSNLEISEQLLTGESVPGKIMARLPRLHLTFHIVAKNTSTFDDDDVDLPIGDRLNLAYASTIVTKGRGTGVTVATAMNTQVSFVPFYGNSMAN